MHLSTRNLGACLSFPPPLLYKHTHNTQKKVNFEILGDVIFDNLGNIRVPVTFFLKPDIDVRISLKYFFSVLDHN